MTILWQPSEDQIQQTNLTAYLNTVQAQTGLRLDSYDELHRWSIENPSSFWDSIWKYCDVTAANKGEIIYEPGERFIDAKFFPNARINYTENLLRKNDETDAIIFLSESGYTSRTSRSDLNSQVSRLSRAFVKHGIKPEDTIAACMPNLPETIVGALSSAAIGATFSSCSPDFGEQGILDRLLQIEPKILIACDGYFYNGKPIDIRDKIAIVVSRLPSLEKVIIVPYLSNVLGKELDVSTIQHACTWDDSMADQGDTEIPYHYSGFNHPLYIMFSSGTTGLPKCIVHGVGGTLLQHMKEHQLHCDIKPGDKVFFYTTCGWMMWNWLVSVLASKATIMLFDGSPFHPGGNVLWDYACSERISFFGTSAKYIQAMEKQDVKPIHSHDLSSLKTIASTGSPLLPENFDFVYNNVKKDVCLSSISGGTDIISCFVLGNPNSPVRRGEIQAPGLGMAVDVWNDVGQSVTSEKGELVCTQAFPCMPVKFWRDFNHERYLDTYFSRFPDIWAHGDFAEQTSNGGYIIYGRSDATLNPGGVRIGTAEIYRQVNQFEEVMESVAVSQELNGDSRILLFVVLKPGIDLDENLENKMKSQIRSETSPRHVPALIYQVPDIPRTRSGKITELAIRDVIHGDKVKNIEALANPEALEYFKNMCSN
jgi:acetoacetyl-CoA synthetase